LIDVCIPNCDDQNELRQAVAHYREDLQILRTKSEFTTEELATKKKAFEMELADGGGEMDRETKLLHSRGAVQVSVSHRWAF
jgi:Ca2+-binding EF-hand superfamily protein